MRMRSNKNPSGIEMSEEEKKRINYCSWAGRRRKKNKTLLADILAGYYLFF
jgi:hypothetical protein